MDTIDLAPATRTLALLASTTRDDQLGDPTPCPAYTVADLLAHVVGLTRAFTDAATKASTGGVEPGESPGLAIGWRDQLAADLDALAQAWTDPAAYDGMTWAGPVEVPGPVAALIAIDEVVVHGWDLAVATGRTYPADPLSVQRCAEFVASFEPPEGGPADDGGLFGPPVEVGASTSDLDRLIGLTGRDPQWSPRRSSSAT
ncbi:MAG: TIGR03086 family protein [Actinobacteria bacterium]|uniref:Unannotated protein n=1 Tax=freshwater metagenome TaxID=449393 RepID=A0A6J6NJC8_9ZZZZ|nr:TIGR03086 family protein [Actinomycetota bacterium]